MGLVDCALSDEDMNQLVIILYSEQGKGKSSWIRRLLPPEWKEYFYNGIIDPSNKDDARLLATRIIINMEEFEGVKPGELAALKRIIAQDNVTQRKAYDIEAFTLPATAPSSRAPTTGSACRTSVETGVSSPSPSPA